MRDLLFITPLVIALLFTGYYITKNQKRTVGELLLLKSRVDEMEEHIFKMEYLITKRVKDVEDENEKLMNSLFMPD